MRTGTVPTPEESRQYLKQGFSLVGHPSEQNQDVDSALASVDGFYTLVFGYSAQMPDMWRHYAPWHDTYPNSLQQFEPGSAYWINVSQDCAYEPTP